MLGARSSCSLQRGGARSGLRGTPGVLRPAQAPLRCTWTVPNRRVLAWRLQCDCGVLSTATSSSLVEASPWLFTDVASIGGGSSWRQPSPVVERCRFIAAGTDRRRGLPCAYGLGRTSGGRELLGPPLVLLV